MASVEEIAAPQSMKAVHYRNRAGGCREDGTARKKVMISAIREIGLAWLGCG